MVQNSTVGVFEQVRSWIGVAEDSPLSESEIRNVMADQVGEDFSEDTLRDPRYCWERGPSRQALRVFKPHEYENYDCDDAAFVEPNSVDEPEPFGKLAEAPKWERMKPLFIYDDRDSPVWSKLRIWLERWLRAHVGQE